MGKEFRGPGNSVLSLADLGIAVLCFGGSCSLLFGLASLWLNPNQKPIIPKNPLQPLQAPHLGTNPPTPPYVIMQPTEPPSSNFFSPSPQLDLTPTSEPSPPLFDEKGEVIPDVPPVFATQSYFEGANNELPTQNQPLPRDIVVLPDPEGQGRDCVGRPDKYGKKLDTVVDRLGALAPLRKATVYEYPVGIWDSTSGQYIQYPRTPENLLEKYPLGIDPNKPIMDQLTTKEYGVSPRAVVCKDE